MCSELSKTIIEYNRIFETIAEARIVLVLSKFQDFPEHLKNLVFPWTFPSLETDNLIFQVFPGRVEP